MKGHLDVTLFNTYDKLINLFKIQFPWYVTNKKKNL